MISLCVFCTAYFQWGLPIYSAKAVRFRMGHPKSLVDVPLGESYMDYENKFIWTYTSQEFPMAQVSCISNCAITYIVAIN